MITENVYVHYNTYIVQYVLQNNQFNCYTFLMALAATVPDSGKLGFHVRTATLFIDSIWSNLMFHLPCREMCSETKRTTTGTTSSYTVVY